MKRKLKTKRKLVSNNKARRIFHIWKIKHRIAERRRLAFIAMQNEEW
ncbi:hypothetical protein NYR62_06980 [Actinobacillus genomosp. 1]|nr:hypothetical protein [Actinobacillus genomosp. 1]WGE33321.1 hypothetical protein NYR61_07390 [Actinobacillus genomosp. 1]WGE35368.1 hypothetical protein NYR62_06980 [Actinobacillus genomosp. 1]WGE90632.1 hypothetical protein NYR63_07260 [Actinobacillus genomosp. 1]